MNTPFLCREGRRKIFSPSPTHEEGEQKSKIMKHHLKYLLPVAIFIFSACQSRQIVNENSKSADPIFPKGKEIVSDNFTGIVYLHSVMEADSLNPTAVGNVSFEPGARSNWHYHPAGQILIAIDGVGYYQEEGQSKRILRKGDAVKCPPNVPHWHGASVDTPFIQLAITGRAKGATVWLQPVGDEEYKQPIEK